MSTIQEQALNGTDEKELPHCDMCGKVAFSLYMGRLCGHCYKQATATGTQTKATLRGTTPPGVDTSRMRDTCGNGHKWTPRTTRWRYRVRDSRHGTGWERDCLVCKEKSDGRHHMGRNVRGRNVTITIAKNGTHWNSGQPGGIE